MVGSCRKNAKEANSQTYTSQKFNREEKNRKTEDEMDAKRGERHKRVSVKNWKEKARNKVE